MSAWAIWCVAAHPYHGRRRIGGGGKISCQDQALNIIFIKGQEKLRSGSFVSFS